MDAVSSPEFRCGHHFATGQRERRRQRGCPFYSCLLPKMFTDIHCHILPNIDDGASSPTESLNMARTAIDDGTKSLIATPHQLGSNAQLTAEEIKRSLIELEEVSVDV